METRYTGQLRRAAEGGIQALQREAARCAREAVAEELAEPAALRRVRFENEVLLDESRNPDQIDKVNG